MYRFVAVLSDATGFGTGGTSPILTVSPSNSTSSANITSCLPTTPSKPQFYLYLSPTDTPSQCTPISISWDTPRNPPVMVYGVIPQGESFFVGGSGNSTGNSATGNSSSGGGGRGFTWTCSLRTNTPFFFVAGDQNGYGTGGSTDVSSVLGGPSGCISAASPSSTLDTGVGSVGVLPGGSGGSGGGTSTGTGMGMVSATATATNDGGQDGGGGGGGGGDGNTNGSGGGTVNGPLDPTSITGISKYVVISLIVLSVYSLV